MNDFTIVFRSLRARLFSTVVTVVTVAIAVALLLTLLSLKAAGASAFIRGSGNAHLLVSADAGPVVSVLNAFFYSGAPARPIGQAKLGELSKSFPWTWVIPVQQGDSYRGFPTLATTPAFLRDFQPVPGEPWEFREGRAFDTTFEAVFGSAVAAETGLRLNAKLHFTHGAGDEHGHVHTEYEFNVVGILAPTGSAHDRAIFCSLESSWILHAHDRKERERSEAGGGHEHGPPLTSADLIDDDRKVTGLLLRLPTRPGSDVSTAMQAEFDRLRRDPTITVANPAYEIQKLLAIVSRVDILFVAMAIVILVGSAISILVALYNSMYERRRQIAIFRVLGCSRGRIFGLVLTESALIGVLGATSGAILSAIGTAVAAAYLKHEVGLVLGLGVDPRQGIIVVAATVVLASVAGILPALLAYRTPVGDTLRPSA
ncbi:MAG: ABC transporter permease [Phycisphaerae bacterium]|nr:ABC transporter permease [Phycisphaerae bacterium]